MNFNEKTVLIVGGTSGIGAACVRKLSSHGANVIFCSNDQENGEKLERDLIKTNAKFVFCDVTVEDNIISVVNFVSSKYGGKLDCLLNNVGTHPEDRKIDNFSTLDLEILFHINVRSYFLFAKYCLPLIRKTQGNIINIASQVGSIGQRFGVTYAMSKGAILAMTKSLALDEAENGVRVNSVSPGMIDTPLLRQNTVDNAKIKGCLYDSLIEKMQLQIPLGVLGTSDDVANTCMFLASDMAKYITGADIPVTGAAEIGYGIK